LPTAVLLVALLAPDYVYAASVSSARSFDAEPHTLNCKCVPRCRGPSCCCGPH